MSKILGIDYGTKRVGLALSDESARFARPYAVLINSVKLLDEIKAIGVKEKVVRIVVGESLDFRGRPNLIMKKIVLFVARLARVTGVPVFFEPEFLTSAQASRVDDQDLDARAAALILQTYLDRHV